MPIIILILIKGGTISLTCLMALLSGIGIAEFYRMAMPDRKFESYLASFAGAALVFIPLAHDNKLVLFALTLLFLLFSLIFLFRIRTIERAALDISYAILAFIYIPFLLLHVVMLRETTFGIKWLFVIMLIVMTNDATAYYIGSAFGKHRLYPVVSPKKSIEGAIAGLFGSLVGTLLSKFIFFDQLTYFDAIITAVVIGSIGQVGDLFESLLKRSFGVKDSGTLIPGHGGVLDRLDSILFAAPVTYYYVLFFFKG